MKKVIGLIIGLVPISAFGECVPVPECASIGYTETSCDGGSIKCPFDTTILKCIPCDSSFRYSCNGENVTSAVGDACNNKYVACNCVAGATFSNGECICDTSCDTIGNIYYSDRTCSSCKISDKTPVGIVAYNANGNSYALSLEQFGKSWGVDVTDDNGNNIIFSKDIEGVINYTTAEEAKSDYNGADNTAAIVATFGETATGAAAVSCYNYFPATFEESKNKWFLPAAGELHQLIANNTSKINNGLTVINRSVLTTTTYWSSSEQEGFYGWKISSSGNVDTYPKYYSSFVARCVIKI